MQDILVKKRAPLALYISSYCSLAGIGKVA